jgi:hypothetical protein
MTKNVAFSDKKRLFWNKNCFKNQSLPGAGKYLSGEIRDNERGESLGGLWDDEV